MFHYFQGVAAAAAFAIVTAGVPALAQYAPSGPQPYVREQPGPSAQGSPVHPDELSDQAAGPPPPPFFLPLPPPFFEMNAEQQPASPSEPSGAVRVYEPEAPRPPGGIGSGAQEPDQAPVQSPAAVARPAPSNLASLPPEDQPEQDSSKQLPPQFQRQLVNYETREPAGTLVVDTANTYLYLVLGGGKALRYGIGVGREGFAWAGAERVSRMAEWPDWHPPAEMIERQPYLPRFMAGGPGNPLGARALYLGKTLYRIHGTNQPSTIGTFVSSGCIRLVNSDIEDLYTRVQVGARVVVLQGSKPPTTAANN
jgi:lipoprotein-anchoring transpeptidase ErfK/SrfK